MKSIYIIITLISAIRLTPCNTQKSLPSGTINTESIDPHGNLMLPGKSSLIQARPGYSSQISETSIS
jgi:hypothetical protein